MAPGAEVVTDHIEPDSMDHCRSHLHDPTGLLRLLSVSLIVIGIIGLKLTG